MGLYGPPSFADPAETPELLLKGLDMAQGPVFSGARRLWCWGGLALARGAVLLDRLLEWLIQ